MGISKMKNSVTTHIEELLFEQDCVVIPSFGGFVTNFSGSQIEKSNKFIFPPNKWLAFNELLKHDDGLLSNYIARKENISRENASELIKFFVSDTKDTLKSYGKFSFSNLGNITLTDNNNLLFQPKNSLNFLNDSFGLSPITLPEINDLLVAELVIPEIKPSFDNRKIVVEDREEVFAEVVENENQEEVVYFRKRSRIIPILSFVAGISLLGMGIYLLDNKNVTDQSSFFPWANSSTKSFEKTIIQKKEIPVIANIPTSIPENTKDLTLENDNFITNVNTINKNYFVIVGSFGNEKNAKNLVSQLKKQGYSDAQILLPNSGEKLIKVSSSSFLTESKANEDSKEVGQKLNQATWVYEKK
jgi:CCDC81-like prokaryotic HU domain 1/CCDC81-like prokaryotic HU domain 2/SPOR domain